MSARAAAQLELMDFREVYHYPRGKADWIVRGLPSDPSPSLRERMRAFPYFVNNLLPVIRSGWIRWSHRSSVGDFIDRTPKTLKPRERLAREAPTAGAPFAVVLDDSGVLLGAIDDWRSDVVAIEAMISAPQTIRPDMTAALAARLLAHAPYLLVSTALGVYLGRYRQPSAKGGSNDGERPLQPGVFDASDPE